MNDSPLPAVERRRSWCVFSANESARPFRAALISFSISDGVRYSRGRKSRLLGRVGIARRLARTDRFSLFGRTNCSCAVIGLFPRDLPRLTGQGIFSGHFSAGGVAPTPSAYKCSYIYCRGQLTLWGVHLVVSNAGCFKCGYPTRSYKQSTDGA